METSNSVVHSILRNLEETWSCEDKKYHACLGKLLQGKIWIGNELKKDRFVTATTISKSANTNLGIKIPKHTISRRLNAINLNSLVASTKPYISKKNKMKLKVATEHDIWTAEVWYCVYFRDVSKFNLFDCDGRRFVRRTPKEGYSLQCSKNSVKVAGGSVMAFGMIPIAGTGRLDRLHSKINATLYKEVLKEHVVPNLRTSINQPAVFMQDKIHVRLRSLLRYFFLRMMLLLWSGQLEAQS